MIILRDNFGPARFPHQSGLSGATEDAKVDFKVSSCSGGGESAATPTVSVTAASEQQFNIFPAIFSRQLNFHHQGGVGHGGKLMDDLRPNLGLLGLVDDHSHFHHHHHHHDKKPPKTEAPDFAALYALPGGLDQQHSSPSRQLADHSGTLYIHLVVLARKAFVA